MPYVNPGDMVVRRLSGDYILQKFPVPFSSLGPASLSGGYVNSKFAIATHGLSGQLATARWVTPPFHSTGLGVEIPAFIRENKWPLALAALGLVFLLPARKFRFRKR